MGGGPDSAWSLRCACRGSGSAVKIRSNKRPSEHRWHRHAPHKVRAGGPGGESGRGSERDWGEILVVSHKKTKCLLCGHNDSSAASTASCPTGSGHVVRAGSPGGGPGASGGRFWWSQIFFFNANPLATKRQFHSPQFQRRTPLRCRARCAQQPQGARVCTGGTSVWAATPIQRGVCLTQKCRCCEQLGVLRRVGGGIPACPWQRGVRAEVPGMQ